MSIEDLVDRDIAMVLRLWPGMSYSEVVEKLGAYDAALVIQRVNALCKKGQISVTANGFVGAEKPCEPSKVPSTKDAQASPVVPEAKKVSRDTGKEPAGQSPSATTRASSAPREMQHFAKAPLKAVSLHSPANSSTVLAGTILATTPVELLGFEGPATVAMLGKGLRTIADLVKSFGTLQETLPPRAMAKVVAKLVKLSGNPALKLEKSQTDCLEAVASSACFYFDWLDVLCTEIPRDATEADVLQLIEKGSLAAPVAQKCDVRQLFGGRNSEKSVEVVLSLRTALGFKHLPIKGDSFDAFMVPTVSEWFETGECENDEEALEAGLNLVLSSPQTELACYGVLRDGFYEEKIGGSAGKNAPSERFVSEPVFVAAAKKLAKDDPAATFDIRRGKVVYNMSNE